MASDKNPIKVDLGFSTVPKENTCDGRDLSPKINLSGLVAPYVALIVEDPDAPSGTFTHWIIWNLQPKKYIPAEIPTDPIPISPIQGVQGRNSGGDIGYTGPCPPPGKPHRYFFRVYGLDQSLNLPPGSSKSTLLAAMKGHIVQQGEAMATYGRGC
jgi:Raf kinase inhibitor-like YbhB/YbcL family protein